MAEETQKLPEPPPPPPMTTSAVHANEITRRELFNVATRCLEASLANPALSGSVGDPYQCYSYLTSLVQYLGQSAAAVGLVVKG